MKRFKFEYCMDVSYSIPVSRFHYTLKCFPLDTDRQKVYDLQMSIDPASTHQIEMDSFGNQYIFGLIDKTHTTFRFTIQGKAVTGLSECECSALENDQMIYSHTYGLTVPGEAIRDYYHKITTDKAYFSRLSVREKTLYIMERLHNDFIYEAGVTNYYTTAEEAMKLGRGVCQDFAHIMISLLVLSGCAARYVTGFMIGEGESHAWVEVLDGGNWYGYDPTNQTFIYEDYVKIASGRDAKDCMINRGIIIGGGTQTQSISVNVYEENDEVTS